MYNLFTHTRLSTDANLHTYVHFTTTHMCVHTRPSTCTDTLLWRDTLLNVVPRPILTVSHRLFTLDVSHTQICILIMSILVILISSDNHTFLPYTLMFSVRRVYPPSRRLVGMYNYRHPPHMYLYFQTQISERKLPPGPIYFDTIVKRSGRSTSLCPSLSEVRHGLDWRREGPATPKTSRIFFYWSVSSTKRKGRVQEPGTLGS